MKKSLPTRLAMTAMALLAIVTASAKEPATLSNFDGNVSAAMRRMAPNANVMQFTTQSKNNIVVEEQIDPSFTLGPVSAFQDLDGPNDEVWFYTTRLISEPIEHEYYTEYILREYYFDIYDSSLNLVGTVHDKMRYADDEVRVPGPSSGIDLLPVVTKNFFNTDDKYEIVVSIAVNSTTPGTNHYYSRIYSLGGPTETLPVWDATSGTEVNKTVDTPVGQFTGFIGDVLDASHDGKEVYYMTFMHEVYGGFPDDYDFSEPNDLYWENHCNAKWSLAMYGPIGADGKLTHVNTFEVPFLKQQGNMESTAPIITFKNEGKAYVLAPHYKEYFFEPYYSYDQDMVMAEGNTFVIDLYEIADNKAVLRYTTEIPVVKDTDMEALYTYYAVGSLRYYYDVDFKNFTTDGTPAYYVQRSNYQIATDDETDFSYYVYDVNGNKLKTIFEYAEGMHSLSNIAGFNPLYAFITYEDSYVYNMVDLIEGYNRKKSVAINSALQTDPDNDPETMLANFDRVAVGDSYMFAFEMREPAVDEDDNDIMRVAWIRADGNFDHMDEINMGTSVYYAQCYITSTVLNPNLLHQSPEHEYMILIKRGLDSTSSASQEELIIAQPISNAQPQGKTLLHLTPGGKGALQNVNLTTAGGEKKLMIIWRDDESRTVDLYDLPLNVTGDVVDITVEGENGVSINAVDGAIVATGYAITVFDARGVAVANGFGSVDVTKLPAGLYIASAGNSAVKFLVK